MERADVKIMKRTILTMSTMGLLAACTPDIHVTIQDPGETDTDTDAVTTMTTMTTSEGDATGDATGANTGAGTGSSGGSADESSTGAETGVGSSTGGPPVMPILGEPCDPMLAADGIAPCWNPESPNAFYTCAPTHLMPDPGSSVVEFRCLQISDANGNGSGIGDICSDGNVILNGSTHNGCENAFCLWNGLETDPQSDVYQNHQPNACPFQPGGPESGYVKGCCSPYCDETHECTQGWTCVPLSSNGLLEPVDYPEVGVCVWAGS